MSQLNSTHCIQILQMPNLQNSCEWLLHSVSVLVSTGQGNISTKIKLSGIGFFWWMKYPIHTNKSRIKCHPWVYEVITDDCFLPSENSCWIWPGSIKPDLCRILFSAFTSLKKCLMSPTCNKFIKVKFQFIAYT